MRVLLLGATGLIGGALAARLAAAGHALVIGARDLGAARRRWPGCAAVRIDFADPSPPSWADALHGVDAVVNAVGIFREHGRQTFEAIHVRGPLGLFEAAAARGIRIVHVSALGADPASPFGYMASKGRAEAALQRLGVAHAVVRPSLVFAPEGDSTRWFASLAALPLTPLPGGGAQLIQPIHLDDLCESIVRVLEIARPPARIDAVGPRVLTLRGYLATFKRALHLPGGFLRIPMRLARAFARIATRFMPLATPEALAMLDAGNIADASGITALLGHAPRPPEAFFEQASIDAVRRCALRRDAQLAWVVPLLRLGVAITWIVTGLVSAFVYPVDASLALLARTGLHGQLALLALYGAATLDIALGLSTLTPFRRWSYIAQLLLIAFYTLVISLRLPEFWAHPYGPVLKNLPMLAAIAALHALDQPHGPDRR